MGSFDEPGRSRHEGDGHDREIAQPEGVLATAEAVEVSPTDVTSRPNTQPPQAAEPVQRNFACLGFQGLGFGSAASSVTIGPAQRATFLSAVAHGSRARLA